jgi:hypothetical protein
MATLFPDIKEIADAPRMAARIPARKETKAFIYQTPYGR